MGGLAVVAQSGTSSGAQVTKHRAPPQRSAGPLSLRTRDLLDDGASCAPRPYSLLESEVTGMEEGPEQVGRGVGSSEPMDQRGQGAGVGKRENGVERREGKGGGRPEGMRKEEGRRREKRERKERRKEKEEDKDRKVNE